MGTSTDAIIWFGYNVSSDDEGWPESVREKLGLDELGDDDDTDHGLPQRVTDKLDELGVSVVQHCSYDYPMYGLAIVQETAWRGSPRHVDVREPDPDWLVKLAAAAEYVGLDATTPPQWWIASMWG